jgi:hypothetical protein
MPSDEAIP